MLLSLFPIYLFSQVFIHLAFNRLTSKKLKIRKYCYRHSLCRISKQPASLLASTELSLHPQLCIIIFVCEFNFLFFQHILRLIRLMIFSQKLFLLLSTQYTMLITRPNSSGNMYCSYIQKSPGFSLSSRFADCHLYLK